jgi:hypothetical protein
MAMARIVDPDYSAPMKLARLVSLVLAAALQPAPAARSGDLGSTQDLPSPNGPMFFPGYPDAYALGYEVHPDSISPNGKYGILYCANRSMVEYEQSVLADYLVSLKPFQIVAALEGDVYFAGKNRSDLSVAWTENSTAGLVTVESRWGPGSVDLIEIADGKLVRQTNLLEKAFALLKPDWQNCKSQPYNENFLFVIRSDIEAGWAFDANNRVHIDCTGETNPKHLPDEKSWAARLEAVWDIKDGRFVQTKITRLQCGNYKEEQ